MASREEKSRTREREKRDLATGKLLLKLVGFGDRTESQFIYTIHDMFYP
jgi:hypothetical protein